MKHADDPIDEPIDERFSFPADHISPRPAPRRLVLVLFMLIGLGFLGTGAGTLIALHYSDSNTAKIDARGRVRDSERDKFERQISKLTSDLKTTQDQLDSQQRKNTVAICTLTIGSLQGNINAGKPVDPLVLEFARQYGCTIPTGLLPAPVTPKP